MDFDSNIRKILQHMRGIDWSSEEFDLRKAYVCCLLAEVTYYRIPTFELKNANRASLIPCRYYQDLIVGGRFIDVEAMLRSADLGDFFVVVRRYAIVVGVRTPNAIFVAIRGTMYLHDWLVNLRVTQYRHEALSSACFHKGFYRAVAAIMGPVSEELRKLLSRAPKEIPIYVTGHSLGGAIAALMHALWGMRSSAEFVEGRGVAERWIRTRSAYTFGMPRYGNLHAVLAFRSPYHIYNERDIVPTVPPRWLGYENCLTEFSLDGEEIENFNSKETLSYIGWIAMLLSGIDIRSHSVELYRERLLSKLN
jgi:hypothetical protein